MRVFKILVLFVVLLMLGSGLCLAADAVEGELLGLGLSSMVIDQAADETGPARFDYTLANDDRDHDKDHDHDHDDNDDHTDDHHRHDHDSDSEADSDYGVSCG